MTLGEVVDWLIEFKGTNSSEIARAAGISAMSISNIRNGKTRNPSVYVLKAVADELGTTVDMILKMTEWESLPEIPKRLPAKEA